MVRFERNIACLLILSSLAEFPPASTAATTQQKIKSKKSAPCEFAPAANATNHATTTNEQTASASLFVLIPVAYPDQAACLLLYAVLDWSHVSAMHLIAPSQSPSC
ncbi:hypothetical protein PCASD_02307 [Puccinia coronata f. sp. avenae]|uniref:Secreted protein n=1 Tax=Puccinia coronata f. sp. avenae TaxID=200324 RepID=A0A2N5VB87_9BASI|nr:hypothetical protein PCASD_02307 [Puccinia coronata f. sp. avenae]